MVWFDDSGRMALCESLFSGHTPDKIKPCHSLFSGHVPNIKIK
jgi:hypothetical protein